jgi:hypothetical protein
MTLALNLGRPNRVRAQGGREGATALQNDRTFAADSRDYARAYSSHSPGQHSGSGSARLDLSQTGGCFFTSSARETERVPRRDSAQPVQRGNRHEGQ